MCSYGLALEKKNLVKLNLEEWKHANMKFKRAFHIEIVINSIKKKKKKL